MYSSSYKLYKDNEICIADAPEIPALQYDNYCAGECNLQTEKKLPEKKEHTEQEIVVSPTPLFIHKIKTDDDGKARFLMQVLANPEDYILRISAYTEKLQTCSIQLGMQTFLKSE